MVFGDAGLYDRVTPYADGSGRSRVDRLPGLGVCCEGDEECCCPHPGNSDFRCTAVNLEPTVLSVFVRDASCNDLPDN